MKRIVLALCIGLMVGLASNAFAAVGDKAEAIFAEFVFVVNGDQKTLDATPIVINGTTYLPTRSVANTLGYDVTYKADSRTIEFNKSKDSLMIETENVLEMEAANMAIGTDAERLEKINDQIAEVNKSITWYQGKIDKIVEELQSNGESEEEISKNPVVSQYRDALQLYNKSLTELEAQKAQK